VSDTDETKVIPPKPVMSIDTDPRSREAVRRLRSGCGLAAFLAAGLAALHGGLPVDVAVMRALGAGVIAWLVGWWAGLSIYRHLIRARVRAAIARKKIEAEATS
jgi:hypothetical protein